MLTAAGVGGGQGVWTLAATAGLAAVCAPRSRRSSGCGFAGATYLVYLGIRACSTSVADRGCNGRPRRARRPAAGAVQQPRQPEDGGVLHQPAPAVRRRVLPGAPRSGSRLLLDDVRGGSPRTRSRSRGRATSCAALRVRAWLDHVSGAVHNRIRDQARDWGPLGACRAPSAERRPARRARVIRLLGSDRFNSLIPPSSCPGVPSFHSGRRRSRRRSWCVTADFVRRVAYRHAFVFAGCFHCSGV